MPWNADKVCSEVKRLADAAWAERVGSGPFRYADGGHNPFLARYLGTNGPEGLAELAARTLTADPELRRKWLEAIGAPAGRKRDAKGRFARE